MTSLPFGIPVRADWDAPGYLAALHTRQLMALRDECLRYGHNATTIGNSSSDRWVTTDQVNAELNTREHIPNKVEAKEIRRQKAHAKRNR